MDQPGASAIFALTLLASLSGLYRFPAIIHSNLFRPYRLLQERRFHTVFTSGFVHADLGHLLFNMFTFYFFAFPLEDHIGTARFLLLYATGLLLSHSCSYFKHESNPHYASLGASGAISAVLFAYIVYFPAATLIVFPIPLPVPAVLFAIGYVAYSWWAARQQRGRINHDAHLCGALAGLVFVATTDVRAYTELLERLG